MPVSPNVENYHIGKGILSFKEAGGAATYVDLGNAPSFTYEPSVERVEHFSSREGVKTKDFTAITSVGAKIKMQLDEITALNLSFFALAEVDETVPEAVVLSILKKAEFVGDIKVVGTNDIGQQVDFEGTVSFIPTGELSLITSDDSFSVIGLEAEVQKNATTGEFGKLTIRDTPAARAAREAEKQQARREAVEQRMKREVVDHG